MPVAGACFILTLITGAMQVYSLYFLYETWGMFCVLFLAIIISLAYILMGYAGATALVGLASVLTGFRIFTILYLLAEVTFPNNQYKFLFQTLCNIPVGVVIGYISYVLANWNDCHFYGNTYFCFGDTYALWLFFNYSKFSTKILLDRFRLIWAYHFLCSSEIQCIPFQRMDSSGRER